MSPKNNIVVKLEREVHVGHIVTDLTMLFGCNTSTPKPVAKFEDIAIANYWLSEGNQSPLYQVSCRGAAQQGQEHLEKAYHFEITTIFGEQISEELEARIRDTITNAPID